MVFTVWLDEFCVLHTKLQTVAKILEENLILDTINIIKKFMIPMRSMDIENLVEESNYKYREWYRNGQISYAYNYKNGREHGICRGWYENGQIWYKRNYEHGKPHGICRTWYENGQIWYKRNYEHGQNMGYVTASTDAFLWEKYTLFNSISFL